MATATDSEIHMADKSSGDKSGVENLFIVKGTREWLAWVDSLREHLGISSRTSLVSRSLIEMASRSGHAAPPKRRPMIDPDTAEAEPKPAAKKAAKPAARKKNKKR